MADGRWREERLRYQADWERLWFPVEWGELSSFFSFGQIPPFLVLTYSEQTINKLASSIILNGFNSKDFVGTGGCKRR